MHRQADDDGSAPPVIPMRKSKSRPVTEEKNFDEEEDASSKTMAESSASNQHSREESKSNSPDKDKEEKITDDSAEDPPDFVSSTVSSSDKVEKSAHAPSKDTATSVSIEDFSKQKVGAYPSAAPLPEKSLPMADSSPIITGYKKGGASSVDSGSVVAAFSAAADSDTTSEKARVKIALAKQSDLPTESQRRFYPGAHQVGGLGDDGALVEDMGEYQPSLSITHSVTPIAAQLVSSAPDVEAQTQHIEQRVREELISSAVTAEVVDLSEQTKEEDSPNRRRLWIILGVIVLLAIGGGIGAAVALTRGNNDDEPKKSNAVATTDPPRKVPTPSPVSTKPSQEPTVFIAPCALCLDGSEPEDLEAEVRRGFTCGDLQSNLAELDNASDQTCKSGQVTAWFFCSCPTLPPRPLNPVCSVTCPVDSRPPAFDSELCRNFETFVEIVGQQVDECAGLIEMTPEACLCSQRIPELRDILSSVSDGRDMFDTSTPQYMALEWLANQDPANLTISRTSASMLQNRYFGALLWFSLGGENWLDQYSFRSVSTVCSWNNGEFGIFCDDTGTSLFDVNMDNNNLAGRFPEEFTKFTSLARISLANNSVSGTTPSSIGDLLELQIFGLDFNQGFGGRIPSSLFALQRLSQVWLDECTFLGSLPENIGDAVSLTSLSIQNSGLTGTIPASLSQLTGMEVLFLNQNQLSGNLPSLINLRNMFRLLLFDNLFWGTIPAHYGQLPNLERLLLNQNALTGTIPDFAGNTLMRFLYLYDNKLTGGIERVLATTPKGLLVELSLDSNEFTGSIPTTVAHFQRLDSLWMFDNKLTGTIPTEFGMLTDISLAIEVQQNLLNGTLPSELAQLTNLQVLDCGTNELTGSIPSEYGKMTTLSLLNFPKNSLNGTIPTELGLLTSLTGLDLGNTQLTGTIPNDLGLLTALTILDLNGNSFNGTIPREMGNLVAMEKISFADNKLTGTVPTEMASIPGLDLFLVQANDITGDLGPFFCDRTELIEVFRADCFVDAPEVLCVCCSHCCDDLTFLCTAQ